MSHLLSRFAQRALGDPGQPLYPARPYGTGGNILVDNNNAHQHSAVWAGLRLRADTVSKTPFKRTRTVGDATVALPPLPALLQPGGPAQDCQEWLWASQHDLDECGNVFGLITGRDPVSGQVARVDLVPYGDVTVMQSKKGLEFTQYKLGTKTYERSQVWHERQYPVPGMAVGLSPIAYAAMSISQYLSAQQFVVDWFSNGQIPKGMLRNVERTFTAEEAQEVKDRFNAVYQRGGIFATGKDWDFKPISAQQNDAIYLEAQSAADDEIARFIGVPAEMIGAAKRSGSTIIYSNITQKALDFLSMNMDAVFNRRELAISAGWLPRGQQVTFDRMTLLRMDPATQATVDQAQIAAKTRTPNELRVRDGLKPFTQKDLDLLQELYGSTAPDPPEAAAVPNTDPGNLPNDDGGSK